MRLSTRFNRKVNTLKIKLKILFNLRIHIYRQHTYEESSYNARILLGIFFYNHYCY